MFLHYDPATTLVGIYLQELKTCSPKNLHLDVYTFLFIIVKTWKQSKYPSVGEWINKFWYIQTMEYHSALKISMLSSHEKTGRKLRCILLTERSQSIKAAYCMISTTVKLPFLTAFHLEQMASRSAFLNELSLRTEVPPVWHSRKGNLQRQWQDQLPEVGVGEEMNRQSTDNF